MEITINNKREFFLVLTKQEACEQGLLIIENDLPAAIDGEIAVQILDHAYGEICRTMKIQKKSRLIGEGHISLNLKEDKVLLSFTAKEDVFQELSSKAGKEKKPKQSKYSSEDLDKDYFMLKFTNIDEVFLALRLFNSIPLAFSYLYIMGDRTYYFVFDSVNPKVYDPVIHRLTGEFFDPEAKDDVAREFVKEHCVSVIRDPFRLVRE